jgi:hypothetical protein
MTSRDFAFWLQGFFEVSNAESVTKEQTEVIKNHLNLVFYHEIDPSYTDDKNKQDKMNNIHNPLNINNEGLPEGVQLRC